MVSCVEVGWSVSHWCLWAVGLCNTCAYLLQWRRLENWLWWAKVSLLVTGLIFSVEMLCLSLVVWGVLPFGCTPCVVHPGCVVCAGLDHHPLIHLYFEDWWLLSGWWWLSEVWRGQMLVLVHQWVLVMVFSNKYDGCDLLPVDRDVHCELSHEWKQRWSIRFEFLLYLVAGLVWNRALGMTLPEWYWLLHLSLLLWCVFACWSW